MKTNLKIAAAFVAVAALGLAGCSSNNDTSASSSSTSASGAGAGMKICEVTDTGGVDDKAFNQQAYKGVTDAATQLGITPAVLESKAETDYATNIQTFIDQGCKLIITVGFLLGDATKAAANDNPTQDFSIVDNSYAPGDIKNNNVLSQVFDTDQAAYLAGYLAAGMSKTGKVGTFGGLQIPTVTVFMDGFANGVAKYNADNGTTVKVLGWDPKSQKGLFTGNFDSLADGRKFAQNLVDEGADIVMPVAGPVGQGSAALAQELGTDKLSIIGVDADQFLTDPKNKNVFLTSVLKKMDATTLAAIKQVVDGTFQGGEVTGTLANEGVGLAPYHEFESKVPAALTTKLDELKQQIIAGTLTTSGTAATPAAS